MIGTFPFFSSTRPAKCGSVPAPLVPTAICPGFDLASATNSGNVEMPSLGEAATNNTAEPTIMPMWAKSLLTSMGNFSFCAGRMVKSDAGPPTKV
ncbi:MAG: hypothetical protein WBE94_08825 [Pseudolabrys sp.]